MARTDTERLDALEKYGCGIALIHDDEGQWIVCGDGMQGIRSTMEPDAVWDTLHIVAPEDIKNFRDTAREAIDAFLDEHEADQ